MRFYRLFGATPTGPFTVYTAAYGRNTHPVVCEVCAVSVRQAYRLAGREVWATADGSLGLLRRWTSKAAPELAPYLRQDEPLRFPSEPAA